MSPELVFHLASTDPELVLHLASTGQELVFKMVSMAPDSERQWFQSFGDIDAK